MITGGDGKYAGRVELAELQGSLGLKSSSNSIHLLVSRDSRSSG
jgi:hypothetical protein